NVSCVSVEKLSPLKDQVKITKAKDSEHACEISISRGISNVGKERLKMAVIDAIEAVQETRWRNNDKSGFSVVITAK
ncbi:hypothetical protein ABK046_48975, partial [Streptomyces caeruleatus]